MKYALLFILLLPPFQLRAYIQDKIERVLEKKGLAKILTDKTTTDKARIIIAAAHNLPSFKKVMEEPDNNEHWLDFFEDLFRLQLTYQTAWTQRGIKRTIQDLTSTSHQKKQRNFLDSVEFQEICTKVDLNFKLLQNSLVS